MSTVYIAGCWDFCHDGHINILRKAKSAGKYLIVAVNSDEFIMSYKKIKTRYTTHERVEAIRQLKIADVIFILEDHDSQRKYIDIFKPRIIVHGDDWKGDSLYKQMNITQDQIKKYNIEFIFPEYTKGISSTMLRNKISN